MERNMNFYNSGKKSEKGFVLITAYLLISVLSVYTAALFTRSMIFYQATEKNKNRVAAFNLAESGLDIAVTSLKDDISYSGTDGTVSLGSVGAYSVQVCPPSCDGMTEPTNDSVRAIKTTGYYPLVGTMTTTSERRSVLSYVNLRSNGMFNFAVFADESFVMTGNANIDSYNSNDGNYDSDNPGTNGDIGTNSTDEGKVSLTGNSIVNGDAQVGPDGDVANVISIGSNAEITGSQSSASSLKTLESPSVETESSGELKLSGSETQTLAAGTYHYSSVSVTGDAQINATGAVKIYVDGPVKLEGNGVATASNKPTNFIMYVTTDDKVQIGGNGDFYGAIYAPNSYVKNHGNGEVFGAIVANTYKQTGNGNIHYDEALAELEGDEDQDADVLSWQEVGTTLSD